MDVVAAASECSSSISTIMVVQVEVVYYYTISLVPVQSAVLRDQQRLLQLLSTISNKITNITTMMLNNIHANMCPCRHERLH